MISSLPQQRNSKKRMRVKIDPPHGHLYGFPKIYDPATETAPILEWLVQEGYPQERIDSFGDRFYYRSWPADPKWAHRFDQGIPTRN